MSIAPRFVLIGGALIAGVLVAARWHPSTAAPAPDIPQQLSAHIDISDLAGTDRTSAHYDLLLPGMGAGELRVESGPSTTAIKLRRRDRRQVEFEVSQFGSDRVHFSTRGVVVPIAGGRTTLARLPRPGGTIEVVLAVAP